MWDHPDGDQAALRIDVHVRGVSSAMTAGAEDDGVVVGLATGGPAASATVLAHQLTTATEEVRAGDPNLHGEGQKVG